MSTEKPQYTLMQASYTTYGDGNGAPCRSPSITNQCAVRMSLALIRNGFSLDGFPNQGRIHRGRERCQLGDEPHLVGANELHSYLRTLWGNGIHGRGRTVRTQILGQQGIVYFNNCFHRGTDAEGTNTGDHIDLWDGARIFNQILGISAGGSVAAGTDLFSRADNVRFFVLPS